MAEDLTRAMVVALSETEIEFMFCWMGVLDRDRQRWRAAGMLRMENIYQPDHRPTGAKWPGAVNTRFSKGADHWNITKIGTPHCDLTQDKIQEGLVWLKGRNL